MFTGIIENMGKVISCHSEGENKVFWIESSLTSALKVDQSVAHNGVCLTVEEINLSLQRFRVTAIDQTLRLTTAKEWFVGMSLNIERAVTMAHRLDGHMVQGHVDHTLTIIHKEDHDGSIHFQFEIPEDRRMLVVPQGSITLDGISLTVAELHDRVFTVSIIPYTLTHTNIQTWQIGTEVNVEYDLFGKYFMRYMQLYQGKEN